MIDFPANPNYGDVFNVGYTSWTWDGTKWVITPGSGGGGGGGASITISDTPPSPAVTGALWWDSAHGQMYVYFDDGSSKQWVPTTNQVGGGYVPLTGVNDGSDAPKGQIGEIISSVITTGVTLATGTNSAITSLTLTPGDWDITGDVYFTASAGPTSVYAAINTLPTTLPAVPLPGINVSRSQITFLSAMAANQLLSLRPCRASLVAPTTLYYLIAQANFSSGTATATGTMWARRAR